MTAAGGDPDERTALERMLEARSVAVVGASVKEGSLGRQMMLELLRGGLRRRDLSGEPRLRRRPGASLLSVDRRRARVRRPGDPRRREPSDASRRWRDAVAARRAIGRHVLVALRGRACPNRSAVARRARRARSRATPASRCAAATAWGSSTSRRDLRATGFATPDAHHARARGVRQPLGVGVRGAWRSTTAASAST